MDIIHGYHPWILSMDIIHGFIARSVARSLGRSVARALARSVARALASLLPESENALLGGNSFQIVAVFLIFNCFYTLPAPYFPCLLTSGTVPRLARTVIIGIIRGRAPADFFKNFDIFDFWDPASLFADLDIALLIHEVW